MDIEAIDRSIDDALSTFAMRGVEVTGYSGDASVPCGWLFQFSTCWRFDGQIATVRVRCTLVAEAPDQQAGLKIVTTADIATPGSAPSVCDRRSRFVPYAQVMVLGMLDVIENELEFGAEMLTEATQRRFVAAERTAPR
jgi:hypothetical protein